MSAGASHDGGQGVRLGPEDQARDHSPADGEVEGNGRVAPVEPRVARPVTAQHRQRGVGGAVEEVRDRAASDDPLGGAGQDRRVVGKR